MWYHFQMEEPQKPYDDTAPSPPQQFEAEVPGPTGDAQIIRSPQDAVEALGLGKPALATPPPTERRPRPRRVAMPLFLFVATCFSTFWCAADGWNPRLDYFRTLSHAESSQARLHSERTHDGASMQKSRQYTVVVVV